MTASGAFVLADTGLLQQVCGPNDQNLKRIEGLFGVPVRVRGNRLLLETDDQMKQARFVRLVSELQEHVRTGETPSAGLLRAVFEDSGRNGDDRGLRDVSISVGGSSRVFPRTPRQAAMIRNLEAHELSFLVGPAGTGKTYIAIAHALSLLLDHRVRRIILSRPVVEAGESLGYLPGDLSQKIDPYLRPLYDAIGSLIPGDLWRRLQDQGAIEIAPLAYMRGRSLRESYVILDEGQNATREQMKMFLTRLGEDSRAVVTGDITQIDLPRRSASGLVHALDVLGAEPSVHVTFLTFADVVRSPLVQMIIRAYDAASDE